LGENAALLPVVGDEGEILEVDETVEVKVAGGPIVLRGLPVVGDDTLVLDVDNAIAIGVTQMRDGDENGVGIDVAGPARIAEVKDRVVENTDGQA